MKWSIENPDQYDDEIAFEQYFERHLRYYMTKAEFDAYFLAQSRERMHSMGEQFSDMSQFEALYSPEVVDASYSGSEALYADARNRILRACRSGEIAFNRCPKCSRLVRTPDAKQCLWCGHDWHRFV